MEAVAQHDFIATGADELSFKKSDIIKVQKMDEDINWYKAELLGKEGYIPANYIKMRPHDWFAGKIPRALAEEVLGPQKDGDFLIRESESTPGDFTLSVKFRNSVQHFKVLRDGAGKYFLWTQKFVSLNAIVDFHRTNSVSRTDTICLRDFVKCGLSAGGQSACQETAEALYDFEPQDTQEIRMCKGDMLTVLHKLDENWWRVRNSRSSEAGLVPATYIRITG